VDNAPLEHKSEIAFADRIAAVAKVSMPVTVGDAVSAGAHRLACTPDGRSIVFDVRRFGGSGVEQIRIMDRYGEDEECLAQIGDAAGGTCINPSVSPNGRLIAFQSGGRTDWEVWVMDMNGKNKRHLLSRAEQPAW
jgi:hypothetical protein